MKRTVFCLKLQKELEGLEEPPFPGELGDKIFNHISKQAWDEWIHYQTQLINEYRLNLSDPKAKEFILNTLQEWLLSKSASTKKYK